MEHYSAIWRNKELIYLSTETNLKKKWEIIYTKKSVLWFWSCKSSRKYNLIVTESRLMLAKEKGHNVIECNERKDDRRT